MPDSSQLPQIITDAYKSGNWNILVSAVIMFLVWVTTKSPFFSSLIKGKAKIWVAAVMGVLGAAATTAFVTNGEWFSAILNGIMVGLGSTGLFELIKRKVEHEPIDANNDGVLDTLPEDKT